MEKINEIKKALKELKEAGIKGDTFFYIGNQPFFYIYCDISKEEEIIMYQNLLNTKDLDKCQKNNLERYIEVLQTMTPKEESAYKKYIEVWRNYKNKTVIKITSDEVLLIKDHYGFYDMRPRIINRWKEINGKFGDKREIGLDLRAYHKNCFNDYKGLNPEKYFLEVYEDYSDCHIKSIYLHNTIIEVLN